ncbi:UMP kinase [candidate division KSB3 bacterium]|uniref:Uridylate kinase n=1 Tax=candidate division KSB3 bacterium TaxID=2044937 RepID=A0A2G6E494_9BACT|nr:MAG: UMP kinase [candidate division KSB3 bacterium]PIE29435.1 MAG: UMP kinase [candidate division KSB3 bacterium]
MTSIVYRRVLLKLSGEVLAGDRGYGIDGKMLEYLAGEVASLHELGIEVAIVIGGGNIFRGVQGLGRGIARTSGDYMGMLATVMNSIALQEGLKTLGVPARIQAAIDMGPIAEPFVLERALASLDAGQLVIFAAGTGHPFFTTDTAASLRAIEIGADAILKATKVDGVYSADPVSDPNARRFDRISYLEVLQKQLTVMDLTAISLCMEHKMPLVVFDLKTAGNARRIVCGESIGTLVGN